MQQYRQFLPTRYFHTSHRQCAIFIQCQV